jgi:uroporphyrinogen-III synthase
MTPRVLVTRAAEDAPQLAHALAMAGFEPVLVPLIERRWLPLAVAETARNHPRADWVLITSATAAEVVATGAPSAWRDARWAAVGPSSAGRLAELGYRCTLVPERATAHDLVLAMGDLSGQTVVYPRADLALPAAMEGLQLAGADVVEVVAYENAAPSGYANRLRAVLPVDATTLLSGSAAERLAEAIPADQHHHLGRVVVIGPSTEKAARDSGLPVHAMAEPHTVSGVVAALARTFGVVHR